MKRKEIEKISRKFKNSESSQNEIPEEFGCNNIVK